MGRFTDIISSMFLLQHFLRNWQMMKIMSNRNVIIILSLTIYYSVIHGTTPCLVVVQQQLELQQQNMGRKETQTSHVLHHLLPENEAKQCIMHM